MKHGVGAGTTQNDYRPLPSLSLCVYVCVCVQYLDAQQIENLTSYLKALHDEGLAKSDHTTLLLNCYTKLADSKKLEEFIKVRTHCTHR